MMSNVHRLGRNIKSIFRPLVVSPGAIKGPPPDRGESEAIDPQHRHMHAACNRAQYVNARCDIARQTRKASSPRYSFRTGARVRCLGCGEG